MSAKETTSTKRTYVVLKLHSREPNQFGLWTEVGEAEGQTDRQAIAALTDEKAEGTFVAVPARSWKPVTRAVQTVTKATWS